MTNMKIELLQAPEVIRICNESLVAKLKPIADIIRQKGIRHIVTAGRGTSKNVANCFKFFCEILAGIPVSHFSPCISTVYEAKLDYRDTLFMAISQSGMSIDTIDMLNTAKESGAITVAITNNSDSVLFNHADYSVCLDIGVENSVVSTKIFDGELYAMLILAMQISGKKVIDDKLAEKIEQAIPMFDSITNKVAPLLDLSNVLLLSRGLMQGVCDEFAHKIRECCYIFANATSTSEFMHGPLTLAQKGRPIILLAPDGECIEEFIELAKKLKVMGVRLIAFSDNETILNLADTTILMPKCTTWEAPFIYAVATQMFVHELSLQLGINPDKPRNITKITITS